MGLLEFFQGRSYKKNPLQGSSFLETCLLLSHKTRCWDTRVRISCLVWVGVLTLWHHPKTNKKFTECKVISDCPTLGSESYYDAWSQFWYVSTWIPCIFGVKCLHNNVIWVHTATPFEEICYRGLRYFNTKQPEMCSVTMLQLEFLSSIVILVCDRGRLHMQIEPGAVSLGNITSLLTQDQLPLQQQNEKWYSNYHSNHFLICHSVSTGHYCHHPPLPPSRRPLCMLFLAPTHDWTLCSQLDRDRASLSLKKSSLPASLSFSSSAPWSFS